VLDGTTSHSPAHRLILFIAVHDSFLHLTSWINDLWRALSGLEETKQRQRDQGRGFATMHCAAACIDLNDPLSSFGLCVVERFAAESTRALQTGAGKGFPVSICFNAKQTRGKKERNVILCIHLSTAQIVFISKGQLRAPPPCQEITEIEPGSNGQLLLML